MKRTKVALAIACFAVMTSVPFVGAQAPTVETQRYIIGFLDGVPRLQPGEQYNGDTVVAVDTDLDFLVVETQNPLLTQLKAKLDDAVRYVEWDNPNYAVLNFIPNDSQYNNAGHWGSKKIGAEAAWDLTLGSTAVKVAHIDSGLNKAHEEFAGQSRVLQGWDFQNNDNNPNDESGCSYHGTHSTGTHGATINNGKGIAGMAQSTILPIKAFYPGFLGCTAGTTPLVNALKYAGDQGAHLSSNSWGSSASSTVLNDAVQYSHDRGVTHVAAAGNSGPCTNCVGYPWKDKSSVVIVVASTTSSDTQSSFSSEGNEVDVAAPGSSIYSSTSGTATYGTLSGTSMATPHVTGTLALVKARQPSFGFSNLDSCIKNTALDLGVAGFDVDFGYGRIRADQAVNCGGAPPPAACNDGTDNDSDGLIDYPSDPGCSSTSDTDEYNTPPPNPACSDGSDNDGDGLVDYPNDPGCSSSSDTDEYNAPPSGTVFSQNFDSGAASGWTTNGDGTLWHLNTGCGAAQSGSYKLVWASSSTCTYNVGDTNLDWAKTPSISLAGKTTATLKFWHWHEHESYTGGAYDVMRVQRSCDNVAWTTLQQWDSRNANVLSWTQQSYSVSGCAGGTLWVRWTADTIDGTANDFDGWRLDTVEVTAS